jgi:hypothetical protein
LLKWIIKKNVQKILQLEIIKPRKFKSVIVQKKLIQFNVTCSQKILDFAEETEKEKPNIKNKNLTTLNDVKILKDNFFHKTAVVTEEIERKLVFSPIETQLFIS